MYRERTSTLTGTVLWHRRVVDGGVHRILPDGCLDLIWTGGDLLVAGPDTTAHLTSDAPGTTYVGLRFGPGVGPTVLGVPAHELRDRRIPLADLWPMSRVRPLVARLGEATDPGAALESALPEVLQEATTGLIARRLGRGTAVAATAQEVGLSERQLHRRCLVAFGYGPKTLVRILRMRRAVALARAGRAFAAVAADAGYADQAHLARDVKALTGVPLGKLVR